MKIIILKKNLLSGLNAVEKAVGMNSNLPVLKDVLLKIDDGKIQLMSTDLELAVKYNLVGKIVENGEIAIPFSVLSSIVKNLVSERVTLEQKDRKLIVSTENYEATIQGQDAHEFPIIPSVHNTKQSIIIPTEAFREALSGVTVAAQYSEIRPEISGMLFKIGDDKLMLVATDTFRLAEYTFLTDRFKSTFDSVSVIVPLRTVQELLRVLSGDSGENIEVFIDSNQILFKTRNEEIISRLIDGRFPEYQGIIPREIQSEAIVNRQELLGAIKLVSSCAPRTQDITIRSGDNNKFLEIYSADSALGENNYKIIARVKDGPFSVVFNWRYLLDGVRVYHNEDIALGVNPSGPVTVRGVGDSALTYVVMPIRIENLNKPVEDKG
ncbi:DNA polymerase III subunit beta [Candidatus Jorgensenbacteria bacterium]|nr:DNA polymerase III subunit beta [Candidatus Jorgensenbacteria bacterium]